jgi:hypothetical protein
MYDVDDSYKNKPNLSYHLECPNGDDSEGSRTSLQSMDVVFRLKSIKAGDICSMSIITSENMPDIEYTDKPGVLAIAKSIGILASSTLSLTGKANFVRAYTVKEPNFTLIANVTFKEEMPEDPSALKAQLTCVPSLDSISGEMINVIESKKQGSFKFSVKSKAVNLEHKCSEMKASKAGVNVYRSTSLDETIKVVPGSSYTIPKLIELRDMSYEEITGLTIKINLGKLCEGNKVYDTETGECLDP